MSYRAYLRRSSISETTLSSEMKSWRRNKNEDRKLALKHDTVDKHMASRRRSVYQEKQQISKDLQENVMKKSPSAEEYLDKSQNKYSTWKEREKERLDRRYRNLNRSYMKEFKNLGLHNYLANAENILKRRKSQSDVPHDVPEEPVEHVDDIKDEEKGKQEQVTFETDDKMSEEEALLALSKLNLEINHRRFSEVGVTPKYHNRRRGSTGSINLAEFTKLRSVHQALTTVAEDINKDGEDEHDAGGNPKNDLRDLNDMTTQSNSVDNKDVSSKDLVAKPKHRASIASLPSIKKKNDSLLIPKGTRLDRRPTLPNSAIPFNYGNRF